MDRRVPSELRRAGCLEAAAHVARDAARRAPELDEDGAFPAEDVEALAREGLLEAPVPDVHGGAGLGQEESAADLCRVLRLVGGGSLPLGRLYEGHVNALHLVERYGTDAQKGRWFADASDGHLFGVWNTEAAGSGLAIHVEPDGGLRLEGAKTFASGAGFVTRALVTGRLPGQTAPTMLVVDLEPGRRADLSAWHAHGMRASATGTVDFTGLRIPRQAVLGEPDDYHRQPFFSAGAWRFAAVQVGGIEAVLDTWLVHLRETGRGGDPHQLARLGEGLIAAETARLWVEKAAAQATDPEGDGADAVAYVNLARLAVERAGMDVLQLAQRSVGLQGFLRGHPLERLSRDLATYLRQPAPDRALTGAARHALDSNSRAADLWPQPGSVA